MATASITGAQAQRPLKRMRSVEAIRAINSLNVKLKSGERLVLKALAEYADENFECRPGVATIARSAGCSERNVPRIIAKLRNRGLIAYDDNMGGPCKTNHYRLLFASNPDSFNPDKNKADNSNPDKFANNPDKSTRTTLANSTPNPDTALSGEWFEGLKEWEEWFRAPDGFSKSNPTLIRQCWESLEEIEQMNPEELLRQITAGTGVRKEEVCDACSMEHQRTRECMSHGHGAFTRKGYRWGNWIAWEGRTGFYSSGWSHDSGCQGCRDEYENHRARNPERYREYDSIPVRTFELRSPAQCEKHGNFILICQFCEYSDAYEKIMGRRFEVGLMHHNEPCPKCESEWIYEYEISSRLDLSTEEWERGKELIMHGIAVAKDWVNQ